MSVIIRLQNLPWSANALDIRNFFHGLSIPEGGVHIVGGELGDAFIAFSTDEDARQAMLNNGGKIKEIQVHLLLSSRSEMHKVIEAARQTVPFMQLPQPGAPQPPILSQSLTSMLTQNMKPTPIIPIQPAIIPSSVSPVTNDLSSFTANTSADVVIISDDKDAKRKDRRSGRSRSRDRQRDRRDRRNRSRSRDHSHDRRRRSRSRERRRRSRDRDRSRDRSDRGSRERSSRERSSRDSESRRARDRNQDDKPKDNRWAGGPQQQLPFNNSNGTTNNITTGSNRAINPWDAPPIVEPLNPFVNRVTNPIANVFQDNTIQNQFGNPIRMNQPTPYDSNRMPQMLNVNSNSHLINKPGETSGCVQMINVPVHVAYVDILRFFVGLEIPNTGIKFINDHMGRRSGVVYIKFKRAEDKVTALKKNGGFLKGVNVLVTNISEQEFDRAIDGLHFSKRDDRAMDRAIERTIDLDDDSLIICENNDKIEQVKERIFSILFLEELPHFVKEHDVVKMFTDYPLLSIKFKPMNDMRKQLSSYVQFAKADDAKQALNKKHLHVLGHKIIKVTACYPEDYEKIKDVLDDDMDDEDMMMDKDEEEPVPEEEVVEEVVEMRDPRQKRLEATNKIENVPFQNPLFNFPMMGNAPTQQFPWRPPLLGMDQGMNMGMGMPFQNQQIPGPRNINFDRNNRRPDGGAVLDCVLLKGLPLRTTDRDILDFFSDVGIIPSRIHIMLNNQGAPSGDCFCEFSAEEEASEAVSKHGSMLGMNEVAIEAVPRAVVREALGMPSVEGPPALVARPARGRGNAHVNAGHDFGGRGDDPSTERGGFPGRGFRGGRGARGSFQPRGRGPFRGRGGMGARGPPPSADAPENFGEPGCVLSLDNVPFRCGTEDVLRFFGDFELSNDDIIRRFNERGQPTGEARVCFRSPREAQMAMQKLNMKMLHGRTVSIRLL